MLHMGTSAPAQGSLTVTATVVSSVGLVIGPDGEQRLIVANAADPADNVSFLQRTQAVSLTPRSTSPDKSDILKKKKKR